jgi:hypothetical protein
MQIRRKFLSERFLIESHVFSLPFQNFFKGKNITARRLTRLRTYDWYLSVMFYARAGFE